MTVKETKAPEAAEREKKKKRRGKKNPFLFLAPLLLFAAGAGIFLYPAVSNYLAEAGQRNVIRRYEAAVEGEDAQKLAQAWEEAEIYN